MGKKRTVGCKFTAIWLYIGGGNAAWESCYDNLRSGGIDFTQYAADRITSAAINNKWNLHM